MKGRNDKPVRPQTDDCKEIFGAENAGEKVAGAAEKEHYSIPHVRMFTEALAIV